MWTSQSNDALQRSSEGGRKRRMAGVTLIAFAAGGSLFISGVLAAGPPTHYQTLPQNPQPTCVVTPPQFNGWFASGSPTLNGAVNPADSLNLDTTPNGNFYRWSYQMFLWLTSPKGKARVFFSAPFYDVSEMANGQRKLTPCNPNVPRRLAVRANKPGPHGLPVIFDTSGHMHEIEPTKASSRLKPLVKDIKGNLKEIADVRLSPKKTPVFLDAQGRKIGKAVPTFISQRDHSKAVQKIVVKGRTFYIDKNGAVVKTGPGQADGNVQLTQNGSIVYYATVVNDVYAYFATMVKTQAPSITQFPTTQAGINQVVAFAKTRGVTLSDPNALAVEVKTAWVDASQVKNPGSYITMQGIVPVYDRSNPYLWKPIGEKTMTLVMVGIHVVGSTQGHPEMLWSTFEHIGDTPNSTYQYNSLSGPNPVTVPQNTTPAPGTSWLFCPANSAGPFNVPYAVYNKDGTIQSVSPTIKIGAGYAIRFMPFGTASDTTSNPVDATPAAANTEVLSLNRSVGGQMPAGDLRNNYFFMGCTWVSGGASPTTPYPQGNIVGTSLLANSTMETFTETSSRYSSDYGCFNCHRTNTTSVSHIYNSLMPLPPK